MTPLVAIVGRPNVGKSTVFNRLFGRRRAIVFDEPGVTRDRQYGDVELLGRKVRLCDTGGFLPTETEGVFALLKDQARIAVAEADVLVFVVDGRQGPTPADSEVADVLRRSRKPVVLAVNKVDADSVLPDAMACYALGCDTVVFVAAEHGRGFDELREEIVRKLPDAAMDDDLGLAAARQAGDALADAGAAEDGSDEVEFDAESGVAASGVAASGNAAGMLEGGGAEPPKPPRGGVVDRVRVCVVGRPNVGKSTLVNKVLGAPRVVTADQPGTTRDAIDIDFDVDGRPYTLVDTAGLRRKRSVDTPVERYSVSQAVRAIERCHIAVLVLDATQDIADQDAKIARLVEDRRRACVVAVTKWDVVDGEVKKPTNFDRGLDEALPFLVHTHRVYLSGRTGQRVHKLMEAVQKTFEAFDRRISTSAFNRWLQAIQLEHPPPMMRGKRMRIYYAAQIAMRPPVFALVTNVSDAPPPAYERFLIGRMRENWDLLGTPVRLHWKKKPNRRSTQALERLPAALRAGMAAVGDGTLALGDGDLQDLPDPTAPAWPGTEDWLDEVVDLDAAKDTDD
ncbi:MAG: ribosome biogenesis GTPase Der [Myxococcales bacterium]|nr:ribosome biogenesis GTPase Der [Myxococcales bacterium]